MYKPLDSIKTPFRKSVYPFGVPRVRIPPSPFRLSGAISSFISETWSAFLILLSHCPHLMFLLDRMSLEILPGLWKYGLYQVASAGWVVKKRAESCLLAPLWIYRILIPRLRFLLFASIADSGSRLLRWSVLPRIRRRTGTHTNRRWNVFGP